MPGSRLPRHCHVLFLIFASMRMRESVATRVYSDRRQAREKELIMLLKLPNNGKSGWIRDRAARHAAQSVELRQTLLQLRLNAESGKENDVRLQQMIELTRDSYLQQMRDHLAAESEELSVLSKSGPGGPIFFIFYPKKIDPAVEFCPPPPPPPRLFGTTRKELGTRDTIILHIYHKTRHYFSLKKTESGRFAHCWWNHSLHFRHCARHWCGHFCPKKAGIGSTQTPFLCVLSAFLIFCWNLLVEKDINHPPINTLANAFASGFWSKDSMWLTTITQRLSKGHGKNATISSTFLLLLHINVSD